MAVGKEKKATLESTLRGIHEILALIMKAPELVLNDEDCAELARAINNPDLDLPIPEIPPRLAAVGVLLVALHSVYKPKVIAILTRREAEKAEAQRRHNGGPPLDETAPRDPLVPDAATMATVAKGPSAWFSGIA